MITNLFKHISHQYYLPSHQYINIFHFSSKLAPQKNILQDWQYVQQISKYIKNNDINQALTYLIQSHLNNQILNKQIYYTIQQKMEQISSTTGYHQILYKLYREHFQPNPMMLNWMKKISKTQNPQLINNLKQDFQKLNEIYPISNSTINEQKVSSSSASKNINKQKEQQQSKPNVVGRKSRKVPTVPTTDDYFSKTPQAIMVTKKQSPSEEHNEHIFQDKPKKVLQTEPQRQQVEAQTIIKIQQVLQSMFRQYGKITLHNVQLQFHEQAQQSYDLDEEMNKMYNQNDQYNHQENQQIQEQEQTMDDYVLQMLTTISKIKIGKIQFQNPLILQKIKHDLNHKDDNLKPQN